MSHYRRVFVPGGCYFFTVVTRDRAPVFTTPARVALLRAAVRQVMAAHPFSIDAMVVLPDHLHCIWRLPEGDADFPGRWREIKKATSRRIHRVADRGDQWPIWQPRFWEHLLRDEADWRRHLDYIHYNPVKHGLARSAGAWPWSSFGRCVARGWYEPGWGTSEPPLVAGMDPE
ncbi:MAG: transposase [Porticoccaceae bacterium]